MDNIEMDIELLNQLGERYPKIEWPTGESFITLALTSVLDKYNTPVLDDILYEGIFSEEVMSDTNGISLAVYPEVSQDYNTFPIDYASLGKQLKNIQDDDIVCIPVYITVIGDTGVVTERHANLLVYRPRQSVVDHFEPHGSSYYSEPGFYKEVNEYLTNGMKTLWETQLTPYIGKVKYISRDIVCPSRVGLQVLSGGELCALITIFMADLCLKNPTLSSSEVIKKVYDISKTNGDYMKQVLNGYIITVYKTLKKYTKDIYTNLSKNEQKGFDRLKQQIADTPLSVVPQKPPTPRVATPSTPPQTPPRPEIKDKALRRIVDDWKQPDMMDMYLKTYKKEYANMEKQISKFTDKDRPVPVSIMGDLFGTPFIHFLEQHLYPQTIFEGLTNSIYYLGGMPDEKDEEAGPKSIKSYFTKRYVEKYKEDFM